jgi:hypothetical protein
MGDAMDDGGLSFEKAVIDHMRDRSAPKRRHDVAFPTYEMGLPRIPGHKVLQLAAELEDEEILGGMTLGT